VLYAWVNVRLYEHSVNTMGLMLGLFSRDESPNSAELRKGHELRVIARKLRVEPELLMLASSVAALLHDAGKAAKEYQESVRQHRPYFTCHELTSGWITQEVLDYILIDIAGVEHSRAMMLSGIAATAVLRHHHGMRSLASCRGAARRLVRGLDSGSLRLLTDEFDRGSLGGLVANALCRVGRTGIPSPLEAEARVRRRIVKLADRDLVVAAAVSTLTGLLAAADYLAASLLDGRESCKGVDVGLLYPRGYARHVLRELGLCGEACGGAQLASRLREIVKGGVEAAEAAAARLGLRV